MSLQRAIRVEAGLLASVTLVLHKVRDKVLYPVQPTGRNDALAGAAGRMLQGGPAAILTSTGYEDNSSTLGAMHAGRDGLREW